MITQRDLDLWSVRQGDSEQLQETGSRSLELRKRSNDLQKKTYTKWINSFLTEHGLQVEDLYTDLQDGKLLVRLLEVISGEKIATVAGRGPGVGAKFHALERIGKAFQFLHQKNIKLQGIQPVDIQEGHVEQTLALIWAIILGFQFYQHAIPTIKKLAIEPEPQLANVHKSSTVQAALPSVKKGMGMNSEKEDAEEEMEEQNVRGAMKALLHWCQKNTASYHGVEVTNFTTSWIDGLAFNALIHKHRPELIDFGLLRNNSPSDNLDNAFDVAEKYLNIPRLLDAEDVNPIPDKRSIAVYLSMYYLHFNGDNKVRTSETQGVPVSQSVGASVPPSKSTQATLKNKPLPLQKPVPNIPESGEIPTKMPIVAVSVPSLPVKTSLERAAPPPPVQLQTSSASPSDASKKLTGKTVSQTVQYDGPRQTELVVGNPSKPSEQRTSPSTTAASAATRAGPSPIRPGERPPPYQPPVYSATQQRPHPYPYSQQPNPYMQKAYPQQSYPQRPYYQQQGYYQQYGYYKQQPYQQPPPHQPKQPYYSPRPPMQQMQQQSVVQIQTGAGVLKVGSQQCAGSGSMMQSSSIVFK